MQYERYGNCRGEFLKTFKIEFGIFIVLVDAVRGADRNCQRINAGFFDESRRLINGRVNRFDFFHFGGTFGRAADVTDFRLNVDAVRVSIISRLFCQANIFVERIHRRINHHGIKAEFDSAFDVSKIFAVVEVQSNRNFDAFRHDFSDSCSLFKRNQMFMGLRE